MSALHHSHINISGLHFKFVCWLWKACRTATHLRIDTAHSGNSYTCTQW